MNTFLWIIAGGLLMSAIAMIGGLTIIFKTELFKRLVLFLISFAAGSLFGGAFFHMIPEGMQSLDFINAGAWLSGGFVTFLGLEQFLHWHHSHQLSNNKRKPVTYLILFGDAIHNFLGGLGIASTFLLNQEAGIIAWIAGAMHEIPQEMGDFGILVHGGYSKTRALLWNFVSALTFPVGALLAYFTVKEINLAGIVLFGAGNFIYIAASDLVPEIKLQENLRDAFLHFSLFLLGLLMMFLLAKVFHY